MCLCRCAKRLVIFNKFFFSFLSLFSVSFCVFGSGAIGDGSGGRVNRRGGGVGSRRNETEEAEEEEEEADEAQSG